MVKVGGIYIPDIEAHMKVHLEDTQNYARDYDADIYQCAMSHIRQRRVAIDVGASFGLWSLKLVRDFDDVRAFEPLDVSRECFASNLMPYASKVLLYSCALGDRSGKTTMRIKPDTTFKTHVSGTEGDVTMRRLDEFDFADVDLIKVDCEGFDYCVLGGARDTIDSYSLQDHEVEGRIIHGAQALKLPDESRDP